MGINIKPGNGDLRGTSKKEKKQRASCLKTEKDK